MFNHVTHVVKIWKSQQVAYLPRVWNHALPLTYTLWRCHIRTAVEFVTHVPAVVNRVTTPMSLDTASVPALVHRRTAHDNSFVRRANL